MMGSGKDAVSKAAGAMSGMRVVHIDEMLEKKAGMKISRIFEREGEEGFRKRESAEISGLDAGGCIINCGGGAVIRDGNREALRRKATVVWLWAGIEATLSRLPRDGSRPLLDVPEPGERLKELLEERRGSYARASDIIIDTAQMVPEEVAGRILHEIGFTRNA